MYPRNAASPERISIGAVVQISDGAVQTSGVTVKVIPFGGTEATGGGTVAYSADGIVLYTPTQAETNFTSFVVVAVKTGCIPASVTIVTTASATSGRVVVGAIDSNAITAAAIATDAIGAAEIAADAVTKIQNGLATPTNITAGTITTVTNLANLPSIPNNWLTAAGIAAGALNGKGDWNIGKTGYALSASGVQAIWDALTSALTTVGSIGKLLVDRIDAAISSRSTYSGGDTSGTTTLLSRIVGTLASGTHNPQSGDAFAQGTAIKAVTDKLDTALELDGLVYRFTINALEQAPSGGGGGSTDWTADQRTAIAAILGIPASGTTPQVPSTGVLATLTTAVADVPTNAELATALGTADDAVLAAIAALNNVSAAQVVSAMGTGTFLTGIPWNAAWDAEVQSECTDALNAYDAPTKAEMDSAFTEIKGATWSSSTDTLEAIRDRGDAAWVTGSGGSGGGSSTGNGTGSTAALRGTTDLTPIQFTFPTPSLTNAAFTTKTRRIDGGASANIAGAISFLYTINGEHYYRIAYNAADRPSAAGVVTYLISDGTSTVSFDLQVIAIASTGGGGGTTFDQAPVTPTGRLRQIIIGDDYLAANGRAFVWTVPAVTGFVAASVTAKFGAHAVFACGSYSFLVSRVGVTDNNDGTWEVSIDLPGSATLHLEPGEYDWSMTLSYSGVNITKIQNLSQTERVKIFASPS